MFINVYMACLECEKLKHGDYWPEDAVPESKQRKVEIQDDLTLRFECENNHKSIIQLEQEKFEVLFEFATMALIDGYTKEAVSTYSSALERFIEFYILAIFMVKKKTKHEFDKFWKTMVKQSERQLGSYLALVTLEGHNNLWDSDRSGFRNKVIHQGLIPTYKQAIDYGDYVLSFIRNGLDELRKTDQHALKTAVWVNRKSLFDEHLAGIQTGTLNVPMAINLAIYIEDHRTPTLDLENLVRLIKKNAAHKWFFNKTFH